MESADFWHETAELLERKAVRSLSAQTEANKLLTEITRPLAGYVGYQPIYSARATKSRMRMLQKARSLKTTNPALTPGDLADLITDLAAGRLLVIGLRDIQVSHHFVTQEAADSRRFRLTGEPEIFLETPKPGGFRGLKQNLSIDLPDGGEFPFEFQIMTFLQHNWDQLQHRIYDMIRSGAGAVVPQEVNQRFEDLSNRLYEVDRYIDETRGMAFL